MSSVLSNAAMLLAIENDRLIIMVVLLPPCVDALPDVLVELLDLSACDPDGSVNGRVWRGTSGRPCVPRGCERLKLD